LDGRWTKVNMEGKPISLRVWRGTEVFRRLRLPDF
jgi:hypothetical protein